MIHTNPVIAQHAPFRVRLYAALLVGCINLIDWLRDLFNSYGLADRYWQIADDCCDCAACEERRARQLQPPRKWQNKRRLHHVK